MSDDSADLGPMQQNFHYSSPISTVEAYDPLFCAAYVWSLSSPDTCRNLSFLTC